MCGDSKVTEELILKRITLVFKTHKGYYDGSLASLFLIVNTRGKDVLYKELGEVPNRADKCHANLFQIDLPTFALL